ncbi:TPA: 5-oxoprolinase [Legionella pneumophila]|nr:hydantoinase B/oxoprolinase family protein [Legionella pneumophila subsp. fraseri]HAT1773158.1 5-oxoprolinase [Legionella pneumophila]MDX1847285.1 hydantoinase B/oxoprolinase family protein [Legionella pneumophila subsp. fraseri]HAT2127944.1 5-oxoprolinase [Legionella pneumophila]HAT2137060.1 5-oxoprolinase [Legionella pneumophila]
MEKHQWEFWIDQGGTFTDIVTRTPEGQLISHKLLSENPECYQDAVIHGIRHILNLHPSSTIPSDAVKIIKLGTTKVTNALLERKGDRVLLAITDGFADALQIAYQNRPDLFSLKIVLPSLLYENVIEIKERIDAKGNIIQPLDVLHARESLKKAYAQGYRTLAIVFMHGYRYNHHENQLKTIAQELGFSQISVSHKVAPVIKLIIRGETTVVDAYLACVLRNYIQCLTDKLRHIPLYFMQSNGGLASAKAFRGKDSIFSGPAGGVVGMVKTSQQAGFERIIGFDMGGTSTDVSHYAGEYERIYTSDIGGIRLHTPMLLIHTIAAGGGSILKFDGQRFIVGPHSAGANPGPACYRRGGPLTITDCNVMVGKIHADFFPRVFGKKGNQSVDIKLVEHRFKDLTYEINQATRMNYSAEQVAEGFLNIAVENMVNAIKKISIQRGYDVTQYALNCFGGASGQHACLVADSLGIQKILIHPLAGVLSAYGIGVANISAFREQTIEKPLQRAINPLLLSTYEKLEQEAITELIAQGGDIKKIHKKRQIHLRYPGSDSTLVIDFAETQVMRHSFNELHRQQFGFASESKVLIIASISIECEIPALEIKEEEHPLFNKRVTEEIPSSATVRLFTQDTWHQAPVYKRKQLLPGDVIKGCAIICESNATTVVEPGWQAEVTAKQHLLLTRHKTLPKKMSIRTQANPIMLEVFNNRFMNIAEQMGEILRNTASSVNIKERLDFSCAIFDAKGELIANAPHIPVHLGSMSESVKSILKKYRSSMKSGDAYILNDPYQGGTHLPDITIITPIWDQSGKDLLFLAGSRGHHADIGGKTPGSMPAISNTIHEEGILIRPIKLMENGRLLERPILNLLTKTDYPARNPQQNLEDFKAQIAANACGVKGLMNMIDQFGLEVVQAYMQHVRDNAATAVKRVLSQLHGGQFSYPLDNGHLINVRITIDKSREQAIIDFSGTSSMHAGNFNAPIAVCKAAVLYVFRCLVADDIPLNSGCFIPIKLIIPHNSLLNPKYPAAVVAGNVETSQCIVDALFGALNVMSASQGTCNNFTLGNEKYQYYETICGGSGASPGFNGTSAIHTHMTNTRLTDPEILEWRYPVLLEQFTIRQHSGGKGKFSGGNGVIRRIRFLEAMEANIISNHRIVAPFGLEGGEPGQKGRNYIQRANGQIEELGGCAQASMQMGDVFIIETPGGGGYGKI